MRQAMQADEVGPDGVVFFASSSTSAAQVISARFHIHQTFVPNHTGESSDNLTDPYTDSDLTSDTDNYLINDSETVPNQDSFKDHPKNTESDPKKGQVTHFHPKVTPKIKDS